MTDRRRVVCAALRSGGIIVCGARHYDKLMQAVIKERPEENWGMAEQGFIDNLGNFLTRTEAYAVAKTARQFHGRMEPTESKVLYSEHLY